MVPWMLITYWLIKTSGGYTKCLKQNTGINGVILRDNGKSLSDREKAADTFNEFFVNIGESFENWQG